MIDLDQLYEIYRRHHGGQNRSQISALGYDRKTVAKYLDILEGRGLKPAAPLFSKEEFVVLSKDVIRERKPRESKGSSQFLLHTEEIERLVFDKREPVKPKTAYKILRDKYGIDASYESFKRFFRKSFPAKQKNIIRIEMEPGEELQMDYGKVGTLYDRATGKNKNVHAFVAILSCSRHTYIEYVYSQNEQSFCESFVQAFEYYRGVPEFISIDNLKSGVIKPHLYEPQINRSFQGLAEHYGTFIDPCRVRTPTDKGKVERMVPLAREEFRRLKALHPEHGLAELNTSILDWCREDYGTRVHGTTGEKPIAIFNDIERKHLKILPATRYEIPLWKEVKVHPDQFIQFARKRYSLPSRYSGETLWACQKGPILHIFKDSELIRSYPITGKSVTHMESDFPEALRDMMNGGYPSFVLKQAEKFGPDAKNLIEFALSPKAYLNTRRAQGMLRVLDEYKGTTAFNRICQTALLRKINIPAKLKNLFEEEAN